MIRSAARPSRKADGISPGMACDSPGVSFMSSRVARHSRRVNFMSRRVARDSQSVGFMSRRVVAQSTGLAVRALWLARRFRRRVGTAARAVRRSVDGCCAAPATPARTVAHGLPQGVGSLPPARVCPGPRIPFAHGDPKVAAQGHLGVPPGGEKRGMCQGRNFPERGAKKHDRCGIRRLRVRIRSG
jgi:hypothetical protein